MANFGFTAARPNLFRGLIEKPRWLDVPSYQVFLSHIYDVHGFGPQWTLPYQSDTPSQVILIILMA